MRKGFLWTILLATVLAVAGCSGKTSDPQTEVRLEEAAETTQEESGTADQKDSEGTEDGQEKVRMETDGEAADAQAETSEVPGNEGEEDTDKQETDRETEESKRFRTVIGTLEELTMDQLTMLSDNGNELTFAVSDAQIDLPSGIRVGNLVSVDYTGKITKKGAKKASAVRIAGSADTVSIQETQATETEKTTEESKEAVVTGKKKTLQGTLTDLTMSTITVKTEEGSEVIFRTIQVPLYFESGLSKGMKVSVVYRGSFEGNDATADTVEVLEINSVR